jgi:hypothetical protein
LRCEIFERETCRLCRLAAYFQPSFERAQRLHDAGGGRFLCERYQLGRDSPGPIRDGEFLNLIISDPQTYDSRSGKILPVLVKQVDRAGVSTLRDGATNEEFEITLALLKQRSASKGEERYFHGVFRFPADAVRRDGMVRWLGAYDTSTADRPHHADISGPTLPTRKEQEVRRKKIIDAIGKSFISVRDFRAGKLQKYGRHLTGS